MRPSEFVVTEHNAMDTGADRLLQTTYIEMAP